MSRYIDTDELIVIGMDNPDCEHQFKFVPWEFIEDAPTADVIPIEWIKEQKDKCFPDSITEISLRHLLADWERTKDEQIH